MRVDEFKRTDFKNETDAATVSRSKKIPSIHYRGVTDDYTVHFDARSASGNGKYDVAVQLVEYPDIAEDGDLSTSEKVRLAISGDLKVSCTCPAYRYWGYEYINSQLGSNAGEDQERFPYVRNPKLEGILCKHIYKTLDVLPMNWNSISADIDRDRFLRR